MIKSKELLNEFKETIWRYVEEEKTPVQREIKETTNLLLDLVDELIEDTE